MRVRCLAVLCLTTALAQDSETVARPRRILTVTNELNEENALCGETVHDKVWFELDLEPGDARNVKVLVKPSVDWAYFLFEGNSATPNTYRWNEFVAAAGLRVPVSVKLSAPNCEVSTTVAWQCHVEYTGGICAESESACHVEVQSESNSFTTAPIQQNSFSVSQFAVLRGNYSRPIKAKISRRLLRPEKLTIAPKALENGAVEFTGQRHVANAEISISYRSGYFPTRTKFLAKGRSDLAIGQTLEVDYALSCPQCAYSQFPEAVRSEAPVGLSTLLGFEPLFIPTLKAWHKYCFKLRLRRKPPVAVQLSLDTCAEIRVEPSIVSFEGDGRAQPFCLTATADSECTLSLTTAGDGAALYRVPESVTLNAIANGEAKAMRLSPLRVEATNRQLSAAVTLQWPASDYLSVTLRPKAVYGKGSFVFEGGDVFVIDGSKNGSLQLRFTPNVDCPISADSAQSAYYWLLQWEVEGDLRDYTLPPPLYVSVLENKLETASRMKWCEDDVSCDEPLPGTTCAVDACALDPQSNDCAPVYVRSEAFRVKWWHYALALATAVALLLTALRQMGVLGAPKLPEIDETEEMEELKVFNTAENLTAAQSAIENILWQIYRYEQNLDVFEKHRADVHSEALYED